MALKTSGSNALQDDSAPEVNIKNGRVLSASANDSEIKVRFQTNPKNSGFQVIQGGGEGSAADSPRPDLHVINGGAGEEDAPLKEGGFYSPRANDEDDSAEENASDAPEEEQKPKEEQNSENPENAETAENNDAGMDPALAAAAGTAAAGGVAAVAADQENDLGDSGTSAAAGTNPTANPEATDDARNAAKNDLKNSENQAANNTPNNAENAADDAKKKENNPEGFKNSTGGKNPMAKIDPRIKLINKIKQFGPLGSILAFVLIIMSVLSGAQSLLPFNISELLRTENDTIATSTETRSRRIFLKQLTKKTNTSTGETDYNVSNRQRNNLAKSGIYVVDGGDNESLAIYDDGSGKLKVIGGSDDSPTRLRGKLDSVDITDQLRNRYGVTGVAIDTENIDTYKNRMATDSVFDQNFTKGSRTWGGSVAAWFGTRTAQFLSRNFITRNFFKNYINRWSGDADADVDASTGKTKTRTLAGAIEESESANRKAKGAVGLQDTDDYQADDNDDGKVKKTKSKGQGSIDMGDADSGGDAASKKTAVNKAKSAVSKITSNKATKVAGGACTVLTWIGSAAMVAAAYNVAQLLPVISTFFETVDKIKVGNNNAPINEVATALVAGAAISALSANRDFDDDIDSVSENDFDTTLISDGKNALQSNALSSKLAGVKMNPKDPVVSSFNLSSVLINDGSLTGRLASIVGGFSLGAGSFRTCSYVRLTTNLVSAGTDLLFTYGPALLALVAGGPAAALVVLGTTSVKKLAKDAVVKVAEGVALAGAIGIVTKLIVPRLATTFMRSIPDLLRGENYGTALVAGAAIYLGRNHLFGGGSPGTREQYIAFSAEQQKVIARNAEIERSTKSPFDYTSQYTFAGSILRQLAILGSMGSSPTSVISTIGTLTKKSAISLMPSAVADADDIMETMMTEAEFEATCPELASIDAYGDEFCNPHIVSDTSTMDDDPEEIDNKVVTPENFSGDQIRADSNLGKYITYCSGRSSNFGIVDANIANSVTTTSTGSTIADAVIGAIPVVGDTLDVLTEEQKLRNMGWITGEQCVASNESDSTWSEMKYYQRYVEDERLKESIYGDEYVSPVTSFIDKYDLENPLDNSYEGVLARYSGLTKDQVIATLDYMDYQNYIADYDPTERYAFGENLIPVDEDIHFDAPELEDMVYAIAPHYETVLFDTRNRFMITA